MYSVYKNTFSKTGACTSDQDHFPANFAVYGAPIPPSPPQLIYTECKRDDHERSTKIISPSSCGESYLFSDLHDYVELTDGI